MFVIKMTKIGADHHHWMMGREVDTGAGFAGSFHQNFFTDSTSPEVVPSAFIEVEMGVGFQITLAPRYRSIPENPYDTRVLYPRLCYTARGVRVTPPSAVGT